MKTIYKYTVGLDKFTHHMPIGARVLDVQIQHGKVFMWAEVETDRRSVERTFWVFGTGHEMPASSMCYIGTFQLSGGSLVFHLYGEA